MIVGYYLTGNVLQWLEPSLKSLLEYNRPEKVYLFTDTDTQIDGVEVINIAEQTYIKRSSPNWSSMFSWIVMARVCTAKFIQEDRILQLDADTIICDSLEELWNTDLEGKWFGAVNEDLGRYRPYGDKYINAGVMLLNLKQIREDHIDDVLIDMVNNRHYLYVEQDAWNQVKADKYVELPTRYNESFCCGFTDDPAIVHYAGIRDWFTNPNIPRVEYLNRWR